MANNSTVFKNKVSSFTGSRKQTIFIADLISEGPIEGLIDEEASVYLDNAPIKEVEDSSFSSTSSDYRAVIEFTGTATGSVQDLAGNPVTLDQLDAAAGRIITLYDASSYTNHIIQSISGNSVTLTSAVSAGTYSFVINRPRTASTTDASISDKVEKFKSAGVEFRKGTLDQTPLSRDRGVGNVSIPANFFTSEELRQVPNTPYPTTGYVSDGFSADGTTVSITASSEFSGVQIKEIDEIRFSIKYPSLTASPTKGDRSNIPTTVIYDMQISLQKPDTSWTPFVDIYGGEAVHAVAETSSPVSFQHTIDLVEYQPFIDFEIRVSRLTRHEGLNVERNGSNGSTSGNEYRQQSVGTLTSVIGVIRDLFSYPYTAYAGLTFSSEDFSSIPQRTYECRGLKVKIPTSYTPRHLAGSQDPADLYTGFWNGGFKSEPEYTDNPAWIFYDIVTNNRYGAGEWISADEIDKYQLYRVARYCDELVPDGKGGFEPRFRANIYLTKATEVYKVLKDFATIFTGMLYWMDGKLTTIIDTPADPVYSFTKGNVIDGKFSYESTGAKTRTNQVIVTWNDPNNNYEASPVVVEDRDSILETGKIINQDAVAFGCTSEGQAIRYGNWKLFTAQKQTEIVSFQTSLSGGFLQPGDIINVSDADRFGISYSGRIRSATTNTIILDREITLNGSSTYELAVLINDSAAFLANEGTSVIGGVSYSRGDRIPSITTKEDASNVYDDSGNPLVVTWKPYTYTETKSVISSGVTGSLEISGTFTATPQPSTIWALKEYVGSDETVHSAKTYRILSIKQDDRNLYSISAVEHFNNKYDAILDYSLADIDDPVYPIKEPPVVPAPQNVYILVNSNPKKPREELVLQWDSPETTDFIAGYEISHSVDGLPSPLNVAADQLRYAFNNVKNTTYIFRVRAVSSSGNRSPWVSASIEVYDPFTAEVNRLAGGLAQGAVSTCSASIVTRDAGVSYNFEMETPEYALAPIQNPFEPIFLSGTTAENNRQEVTGLSEVDTSSKLAEYLTSGFILFESDANSNHLKLIKWDFLTFKNLYYWYDAGTGDQVPQFVTKSGSATLSANSNKVVGSGTAFLTDFSVGDVIVLDRNNGFAAKVSSVESDTLLIVDRSFNTAFNSFTPEAPELQIDFLNDCVISRVYKKGGEYFYENFLTIDPSLYDLGRAAIVDSNVAFLNYDGDETAITTPAIIIDVDVIGYRTDAEIAIIWTDGSIDGASDGTLATPLWQPVVNNFYQKTVHSGSSLAYNSGDSIDFQILVRSKLDPDNTAKQITKSYSIKRIRDGSIGKDGKTVQLNSDDYSIIYDKNGINPSYNGSADNDVDFAANANNFVSSIYRFTIDGVVGSWTTSSTSSYAIPANFTDWTSKSIVIEVEVAENDGAGAPLNGVEATDSISLFAVKVGMDGLAIILSNDSHTIVSDSTGLATNTPSPNSGTSIEVIQGGIPLQYVASNPVLGEWTVTASPSTDVTFGGFSTSGNLAVTGDHSFAGTDLSEFIDYTVTVPTGDGDIVAKRSQTFSKSVKGLDGADGVDGAPGADGSDGIDARAISLSVSDQTFEYDTEGLNPEPASITVSTSVFNTEGTPYYTFYKNDIAVQGPLTTSTYTYTPEADIVNMPEKLEVELREGSGTNAILARDQITVYGLKRNSSGTTVLLSNEAHTIPADETETPTSYAGSGTEVEAWIGTEKLTYAGTGPNTYSVSATGSGITPGSNTNGTFGVASAMTTDPASITYTVTVRDQDEKISTFTKKQSFSKSVKGDTGADGPTGASLNIIFIRSATQPATPSPSTGVPAGWSDSPPAGTDPLWSSTGIDTVESASFTWKTPVKVEGSAVAEVYIYRLNSSSGASGGSYDFTTNSLTPPAGWSTSPPALNADGDLVYVSVALFAGAPTETSATASWSSPVTYAQRVDGTKGTGVNIIFIRSATQPATPSPSTGVPAGWSDSPPAGTNPLWSSSGVDTINSDVYTWKTPVRVEGSAVAEVYIYRLNSSSGASGGSYNFTTNSLTPPTGWSVSPPALNSDGDIVYVSVALFTGAPTETSATASWSSPVAYAQRVDGAKGDKGDTGDTGATGDEGIAYSGGVLYYSILSATNPGSPADVTSGVGNLSPERGGWSFGPPQIDAASSAKPWVCSYEKTYNPNTNRTSLTYSSAQQSIQFSGLVTFSGGNFLDADDGTTITQIDGGNIATDSITAVELKISNNTSSGAGIYMDGDSGRIEIRDSTGNVRVTLGAL